jgi:hypothetical protein
MSGWSMEKETRAVALLHEIDNAKTQAESRIATQHVVSFGAELLRGALGEIVTLRKLLAIARHEIDQELFGDKDGKTIKRPGPTEAEMREAETIASSKPRRPR